MKFNTKTIHIGCVFGILIILGGCIHYRRDNSALSVDSNQAPRQSLDQTTVCCDSFAQLGYKELPAKSKATLYLDAEDPAFDLATGKSYVESILLPRHAGVTLLQIQSLVSQTSVTATPTVVYPVVTLLDSHHNAIATLDRLPFTYKGTYPQAKRIEVVVTIDDKYADATYALIHTSTELLSYSLSTRDPVEVIKVSDFDTVLYAQPSHPKKRIRFSRTGVFEILAYPL